MEILKGIIGTILLAPILWVGNSIAPHTDAYQTLRNRANALEQKVQNLQKQNDSIPSKEALGGTFNFVASGRHTLSGSGISSTDTSIGLTSFTKPVSGLNYVFATDFGDIAYGTIEPQSATRKEFISFTGITYSGTAATLTGVVRGLEFNTPYNASSTLRLSHSGGTTFIISNSPQLYAELAVKRSAQTILDVWNFSATNTPRYNIVPANHNTGALVSTTSEFASLAYVNAVALSGSPDAAEGNQGVVELATQTEAASSTSSGSEARLVLPASIATSTCGNVATAPLRVVVTDNAGDIAVNCLDNLLSANNTFTGQQTFNTGTTTLNATTSISAAPGTGVRFRSLAYSFPAARGASSTILMEDGAGALTWEPAYSRKIFTTTADVNNTDVASTTLMSFTLPANSLGVDGVLHIHANFNNFGSTPNNMIFAVTAGGTPIGYASSTVGAAINTALANAGIADIYITSSATNAQETFVKYDMDNNEGSEIAGLAAGRTDSSTIDTTAAQTIALVLRFGTAGAQTRLNFTSGYAEVIR